MPKLLFTLYQFNNAVLIYHKLYPLYLYKYIRSVNSMSLCCIKRFTGYKDINEKGFYINYNSCLLVSTFFIQSFSLFYCTPFFFFFLIDNGIPFDPSFTDLHFWFTAITLFFFIWIFIQFFFLSGLRIYASVKQGSKLISFQIKKTTTVSQLQCICKGYQHVSGM